ncbi:hypothetical protein ACRRTK_003953 [Alexandromys fortis]
MNGQNSLKNSGAREMAQQLRALAALPEVLNSIHSTHMAAHSFLWDLMSFSGVQMYIQIKHK